MSLIPTGRLLGNDLVLTRTFRAPVEDVWASITDPARTARWFGPWEGEAGVGRTVKVQMAHEEGRPWMDMVIDACEPPHRLAISAGGEPGGESGGGGEPEGGDESSGGGEPGDDGESKAGGGGESGGGGNSGTGDEPAGGDGSGSGDEPGGAGGSGDGGFGGGISSWC
ncbi:hypothetical protein Asp14428_71800 [Actinoplanes sp. NBRC 14428]|nr:hypothetical protein Asp14428_71800 [Actinoplanes sp. NBRC 14428]